MSPATFLETVVSLSLQIAVLIIVTALLVRSTRDERVGDRLWRALHLLILLLTISDFALPRLRLFPHSFLTDHMNFQTVVIVENQLGQSLLTIWFVGFFIGLMALLAGAIQLRRLLHSASRISPEALMARLPGLVLSLPDGRKIQWMRSDFTRSPFCWQIHQPIVVLPTYVLDFEDDELQAILEHETAHLIAGHPLHLFLQRMVEVLFWFHPLVWWASWQASSWREYVSDRAASQTAERAAACLRSLLKLAGHGTNSTESFPAGLAFGSRRQLTQRRAVKLANFDKPRTQSWMMQYLPQTLIVAALVISSLQLPLDVTASERSVWSPWPTWSAVALHAIGIPVRDYEIDSHRTENHNHSM